MTSSLLYKDWHLVIGGCGQREGSPNGQWKLFTSLYERYAGPRTVVQFREWDAAWPRVASMIQRLSEGFVTRIGVYAYSWGAGWGAVRLARALRRLGIGINVMCLCDPIYCSPLRCLRWLAYCHGLFHLAWNEVWPAIRLPENVGLVRGVGQREDSLRGHPVYPKYSGSLTVIEPFERLHGLLHTSMEDSAVWQAMVRATAAELAAGKHELRWP